MRPSRPPLPGSPPHLRASAPLCLLILWALLFASFASLPGTVSAAEGGISFSVAESVSTEDAAYVREGVALAERYVADVLSDVSDERLVVNVRHSDDTTDMGSVAFSGGDYIVVFTGSLGWARIAPFERVHVVVHEYIHSYQYFVSDGEYNALPSWFIEGMADYLAYDAVAQIGLVSDQDVRDFHTWAVNVTAALPPLEELEERDAFYNEYGPVYSLGYLAIEELLGDRDPEELDRFLRRVARGVDWQEAFTDIFDMDIDEFYRAFDEVREELIAPNRAPEPFTYVRPTKRESVVAIDSTSSPIALGGQLTVLAHTEAGAVCRVRVRGKETGESVGASTFADGSGQVFWLVTVPVAVGEGAATVTANCGGGLTRVVIEIDASD